MYFPKNKFEKNVEMITECGCWIWLGKINSDGYGQIGRYGKLAHRYSWELYHGEIKKSCVLHRCDTRSCVNPNHLFLGSQKENMEDMVIKKRQGKRGRPRKTSTWR